MRRLRIAFLVGGILLLLGMAAESCYAQSESKAERRRKRKEAQAPVNEPPKTFRIEGGIIKEVKGGAGADSTKVPAYTAADSLAAEKQGLSMAQFDSVRMARFDAVALLPDSLAADSLGMELPAYDSLRTVLRNARIAGASAAGTLNPDSLMKDTAPLIDEDAMSRREKRRMERELREADTSFVRYSRIFADTMPISRMSAISMVVPGFAQLHNKQAWKIPILYGVAGTTAYLWHRQNQKYKPLKKEYDFLVARGATRGEIEPVQRKMIQHNTMRQVFMAATIGTYMYFVGDGAVNYPGNTTSVKKATTLSTIFPGAGQIYNGSYWKVPIVVGGFAAMAYIIDWNNRGYKRMDKGIRLMADGDPETVSEFDNMSYSISDLARIKRSYRRNRDLAIILTGALYLLNVIDAHVDAHLKDYDISDDLSMNVVPTVSNFTSQSKGNSNTFSLSLQIKF